MTFTKESLLKELLEISLKYDKKNPKNIGGVTRDFYLENSENNYNFKKFWKTFEDFKKSGHLEKEKAVLNLNKKVYSLKDETKKLKKEKALLLKEVISHEHLLDLYKENLETSFAYPSVSSKTYPESSTELILNISDVHLGEVVKPEEVNYVNEYNKEVCITRLNTLFNETIKQSKKFNSHTIHIMLNGDILSGGIHQELARNSDLNEVESLFYIQNYLINKFVEISEYFNKINVTCIVGNHSRILAGKPYFKEKILMNYEYLLGKQLELYFNTLDSNKKIIIDVPLSPFVVKNIKGLNFLVLHGDILTGSGSGGFAGIPYYSICMSSAKFYGVLAQLGITESLLFDHILMGHLHSTAKIPLFNGGICYVNGSVIGTNEYSLFKMRSVAKQEQLLLVLDDNGIQNEINIRL